MGLLTQEERAALIGMLSKLSRRFDPDARRQLYSGIPVDLQNHIADNPAPRVHFISMVNTVDDEAWGDEPPFEGKWPILDLIQNAALQAGSVSPGPELQSLLNKLKDQLGIPVQNITQIRPKSELLSRFIHKLDDLIQRIPGLQTVLQDISDSFNNRIYPGDCNSEHDRLTQACQFVCDFSALLSQSAHLPSEIDSSSRIALLNELKGFEKLVKATADEVSAFCEQYGAERAQPPEYRLKIRLLINELKQSSTPVLNKAQELRKTIHE